MGRTLWIGNLNPSVGHNELADLFARFGRVARVSIPKDSQTQAHKGFGYVVMGSDEEARLAREALHGAEVAGQTIAIDDAQHHEQEIGPHPGDFGDRSGYGPAGL